MLSAIPALVGETQHPFGGDVLRTLGGDTGHRIVKLVHENMKYSLAYMFQFHYDSWDFLRYIDALGSTNVH